MTSTHFRGSARNPWVAPPDDNRTPAPAPAPRSRLQPHPHPGVTPGPIQLPRRIADQPVCHVLGAHGGAGETTLAYWLELPPAEHAWPQPPEHAWQWPKGPDAHSPAPVGVLVVARTNAAGLHAAQDALRDWASGTVSGVDLLGLVLVADQPGRLPRALRDFAIVIGGGAPVTIHLGWVDQLRLGSDVNPKQHPGVRRPLQLLRDLIDTGSTQTTTDTPRPPAQPSARHPRRRRHRNARKDPP